MLVIQHFHRYFRYLDWLARELDCEIARLSSHYLWKEIIVRVFQGRAGPATLEPHHFRLGNNRFQCALGPESLHINLFQQVFLDYFGFACVEHLVDDIFKLLEMCLRD